MPFCDTQSDVAFFNKRFQLSEIANGNAGSIGLCFRQQSPKLQSVIGTQIEKAFTGISAYLNPHIPRKKIRKFHKVPPA